MKINKNAFTGTSHVFRFTLKQLLCSKANIISMIIMVVMAMAILPVMALVSGGALDKKEQLFSTQIYVQNETGYELDLAEMRSQLEESSRIITETLTLREDETEMTAEMLKPSELYVHLYQDMEHGVYSVDIVYGTDSVFEYEYSAMESLQAEFIQAFNNARFQKLGVTPEQLQIASGQVTTDVDMAADYLSREQLSWDVQYGIQMIYDIIILMICTLSISFIIRAVTEEKTSKLVEMLVVTIRPLALLAGKILAVMAYMVIMIAVMAASALLSYLVCRNFMDFSVIGQSMEAAGISSSVLQIGAPLFAIILVSLLLAYVSFALLSGLFGAACSTTEDMQSAMMVPTMLLLGCYFVTLISTGFNSPGASMAFSLIPFLSGFCMPVRYLLGDIGMGTVVLSWLIQLLVIAGLMWFSSRIYQDLIIFRGQRLKVKDMIRMAKQSSKA